MGAGGSTKKGQTVLTNAYNSGNMWYGLYKAARQKGDSTNREMLWGCQYDQIILSIGEEAQTDHSDRQPTSPQKSGQTTDVMKNIYDLEGNYWEWTAEATFTYYRPYRGGIYSNASSSLWYPASYRSSYNPTSTYGCVSSRPAIYVNL